MSERVSERYDARRLKREWIAKLASGEKPRSHRQDAIDAQAAFERRARSKLVGAPVIVNCNHGVPWLDCLVCSKPRSRP